MTHRRRVGPLVVALADHLTQALTDNNERSEP